MSDLDSNIDNDLRVIPPRWIQRAWLAIEEAGNIHPGLDRVGWNMPKAEPFSLRSVATAMAFIECGPVTRLRIPRGSSYALKHNAEWWGQRIGFESYVGNGDLILASIHCGLLVGKPHGPNSAISLRACDRRRWGADRGSPTARARILIANN
jgi:hypothetical protein